MKSTGVDTEVGHASPDPCAVSGAAVPIYAGERDRTSTGREEGDGGMLTLGRGRAFAGLLEPRCTGATYRSGESIPPPFGPRFGKRVS